MGIHDRDYYRDGGRGLFDAWGRQRVTVWLIAVTCAAWVAQLATLRLPGGGVTGAFIYDPDLVRRGEVWRLLTPVFLHDPRSPFHLFFNMLVLYWAGSRLEDRYGGREFLLFYLAAGLFAGVVDFLVELAGQTPPARALGASGAVTAVLVLYACHYPRQQILLFFVIPMPVWLVVVLYVGLDAIGAFGGRQDGIGYVAHLAGALFGLLYYQTGIRLASILPEWGRSPRRPAPAPRLRVVPIDPPDADDQQPAPPPAAAPPADAGFDARVDAVLAKVSKYGQETLTPEEREILFRAGELYKKRRK
ncbi:MAG: rhomboid family intramembrane serine protease [Gemmataceae bacterium]|nr:rhomboid family intramembrane serine protease [Gemmataceae bacterium]